MPVALVAGQTRLTKRHATNQQKDRTRPPLLRHINIMTTKRHGRTSPTTAVLVSLLFTALFVVLCRLGPGRMVTLSGASFKSRVAAPNSKKNLMFLAFYYPWYDRDDWSRHGTQGSSPLLGPYGSNEREVAERHIDMSVRGGIDGWVVSWWEQDSPITSNIVKGMLSAKNIDKIKFCMIYESMGALPVEADFANGTLAIDKFISDMIFFRDSYFGHPSYLHINGRPVVYVYVTRFWKNFEAFMLEQIKTAVGTDILIIADDPFFGHNVDPMTAQNGVKNGASIFEAYTAYNMYEAELVSHEGEPAVDYMLREAFPIYANWSKSTVFFPHVLPKYHDFREGHKAMVGDAAGLWKQLEIFACLPRPPWYHHEFPDIMFVTSFNEWWEGTSIEPDAEDKYGYIFLDTIRTFKDSGVECQRAVPSSDMEKWYELKSLWNFVMG